MHAVNQWAIVLVGFGLGSVQLSVVSSYVFASDERARVLGRGAHTCTVNGPAGNEGVRADGGGLTGVDVKEGV